MLIAGIASSIAAMYLTGYWLAGLSVAVLFFIWYILPAEEGPPILALALTYQWMQVTIGLFYSSLTGDMLQAFGTAWDRMMLIGLTCVALLALGARFGVYLAARRLPPPGDRPAMALPTQALLVAYVGSVIATGLFQELAWQFPALTQAILALNFSHLALVYLVLRRFSSPVFQWQWIAGVVLFEVAMGFTGYFAGFREPLIMAFIMLTEIFNRRDVRHWAMVSTVAVVLAVSSLVWISVRDEVRADLDAETVSSSRTERLDRMRDLSAGLFSQDWLDIRDTMAQMSDRLWAVHYPALALERVPSYVAHTEGQILGDALLHLVTPRLFFPNKGELASDSEMVRKYAGVRVAGWEEGTSIAFGYTAESYVDFGLPWMFLPVAIWGIFIGVAYRISLHVIQHRELAIALVTVVFWLALYLFERSWVKTLGTSITLLVYLGGLTYLVDRYLMGRRLRTMIDLVSSAAPQPSR